MHFYDDHTACHFPPQNITGFVELDTALALGEKAIATTTSGKAMPTPASSTRKQLLTGEEPIYAQLRDINFSVVGARLNRTAKALTQEYEVYISVFVRRASDKNFYTLGRHALTLAHLDQSRHAANTVTALRSFVGKLSDLQSQHQSLALHTRIAEHVQKRVGSDGFRRVLDVQQSRLLIHAYIVPDLNNGCTLNFLTDQGLLLGDHSSQTVALDAIEAMIARREPLVQVLRLLSLVALTCGGLRLRVFDHFRRELCQVRKGWDW